MQCCIFPLSFEKDNMCSVAFFHCHLMCAVLHFPLSFENDNVCSVAFFHCHLRMNLTVLHFFQFSLVHDFFCQFCPEWIAIETKLN